MQSIEYTARVTYGIDNRDYKSFCPVYEMFQQDKSGSEEVGDKATLITHPEKFESD